MTALKNLYLCGNPAVSAAVDGAAMHLRQRRKAAGSRVFLLCGCARGAGVSTLCHSLAIALAATGEATLLVDANLTDGPAPLPGGTPTLASFVAGRHQPEELPSRTNHPGLHVVPAGEDAGDASPLHCAAKLPALLQALAGRYSYVLIDAPPFGLGAQALAPQADETLLVAAFGRTRKAQLAAAHQGLAAAGARVAGVLLNRADHLALHRMGTAGKP